MKELDFEKMQRVPWLGKMPVLGPLFSSRAYQRRETDLVIIVTPFLVQPIDPTKKPLVPTDGTMAASNVDYFLGNVEEVKAGASPNALTPAAPVASVGHFLDLPKE